MTAYAATIPLLNKINTEIINPIISFLLFLALAVFLWGLIEFLAQAESQEAREKGKQHMLWGTIGLCIMVGVFGILNLICNTISC